MKIFSTITATALLLGAGAIMHSTPASAMRPLGDCIKLAEACSQGDQSACQAYDIGCSANPRLGSAVGGTPPAKSNDTK